MTKLNLDEQRAVMARAVAAVGGSQAELARRIGCTQVFAHQMTHGLRSISARLCIPIERATDGAVTRYELRPDVFGPAPAQTDEDAA